MNAKEFSVALGNVRNEYVTEAVTYGNTREYCDENIVKGAGKPTKKTAWVKWGTMAACICAALIGAVIFLNQGAQNQLVKEEPPVGSSGTIADFSDSAEEIHLYYYSELVGTDNAADKDICAQFAKSAVDLAAFSESMLEECAAVIEGEIVNIHLKNYTFTTAEDKFNNGGTLNYNVFTVVYEIKVAKVWYGELTVGDIVTVEDQSFFADEVMAIKNGHSYVIPIYEAGNEIWSFNHKELLSGDIQRDSIYSTVYPYHPQIEAVADGYIVSTDWETLTGGEKSEIIIDIELGENGDFYKDKMMFIPTEAFSEQMGILIERIFTEPAPH